MNKTGNVPFKERMGVYAVAATLLVVVFLLFSRCSSSETYIMCPDCGDPAEVLSYSYFCAECDESFEVEKSEAPENVECKKCGTVDDFISVDYRCSGCAVDQYNESGHHVRGDERTGFTYNPRVLKDF